MDFTNQRSASPRKLSLENGADENLPLYEEFQHAEGQGDELPNKKATPMEVSDFLTHLLINTRGMSTDGARRVAALWTRGTGQELRSFPPAMFFEIFGKEDGWIVFREVHLAIHREKSKTFRYRYGACEFCTISHLSGLSQLTHTDIFLAVALCYEAIMVSITIAGINGDMGELAATAAALAALLGIMLCMVAVVTVIVHHQSAEKGIERQLSAALSKNHPQQT